MVYDWCMSRTNINIDDKACTEVMRRYRLATKREAVNSCTLLCFTLLCAEPAGTAGAVVAQVWLVLI